MLNEVSTTTATSISLSWSVPTGSVVTQYLVEWQRDTSVGCTDEEQGNTTITDGSTVSYDIPGLEENSRYTITVTVSNSAGTAPVSNTVAAMTLVAGERERVTLLVVLPSWLHSSICPSFFCECLSGELHCHLCPVGTSGTLC